MADAETSSDRSGRPVGFVGLGAIGGPMALQLVAAGMDVLVYDVRAEAVQRCVDGGARAAQSLAEVAEHSEVVSIAVVDDEQVTSVVAGDDGLLPAAAAGTTMVIHSTILPWTAIDLAERADETDMHVIDAPVSGGPAAADAGTLSIMVGGDRDVVQDCDTVLKAMGSNVLHLGPTGAGAAGKLANQLMTMCNQLAALEAMKLARSYDIEEDQIVEMSKHSLSDSWIMRNWGFFDRMVEDSRKQGTPERFRPWSKDLWDVVQVAREKDLSLPLAGLASQISTAAFNEHVDSPGRASESDEDA